MGYTKLRRKGKTFSTPLSEVNHICNPEEDSHRHCEGSVRRCAYRPAQMYRAVRNR